jgi:DNA polymerase I-like protein with 3'-5' exonuclease and polymerase domains
MLTYLIDTETNGLLPELDTIHSLCFENYKTGEEFSCHDHPDLMERTHSVTDGLEIIREADCIVGHNVQGFDLKAIKKVYPKWDTPAKIRDTLVMSQLIWSDMYKSDMAANIRNFPGQLRGRHSLKAWGYRLGQHKGDYDGGWLEWNPDMQLYCGQDVKVLRALLNLIRSKKPTPMSVEIEHEFAAILDKQQEVGVRFNVEKAQALLSTLAGERERMRRELVLVFPPWFVDKGVKVVKKSRRAKRPDLGEVVEPRFSKKTGKRLKDYVGPVIETWTEGAKFSQVKYTDFNPSSQAHIADRFKKYHGWKPTVFGKDGKPSVTDDIVRGLPYPEAPAVADYLMVQKRIGALAEGKGSWLNLVQDDGRIHGRIIHNGTPTGRCRHYAPNLTAVPKVTRPYGPECRELFEAGPGMKFMGCDAAGLEARILAHFMYPHDNGAYADVVLNGDIHEVNRLAFRMFTRDRSKTGFYALIYGCYDKKLGEIYIEDAIIAGEERPAGKPAAVGKRGRAAIMSGLPALKKVIDRSQEEVRKTRGLIGLDGRFHPSRSAHSALNLRIQGAASLVMKKSTNLLWQYLQEDHYNLWVDVMQVIHAHDEFQLELLEAYADAVGEVAARAIKDAGEFFNLNVPMKGEFKIGNNWKETH